MQCDAALQRRQCYMKLATGMMIGKMSGVRRGVSIVIVTELSTLRVLKSMVSLLVVRRLLSCPVVCKSGGRTEIELYCCMNIWRCGHPWATGCGRILCLSVHASCGK